ncbi:CLUMA_CG006410, isoform A [Clunio marinus]|uniref:CLUMA_CG006410, isoform A n=1 Tax=Clunio marinus TaxID=568069 RepID=A0A1J1I3E7_9DIPT|nr:CLUMA_CG006410, isoform A [Clunio marinus]
MVPMTAEKEKIPTDDRAFINNKTAQLVMRIQKFQYEFSEEFSAPNIAKNFMNTKKQNLKLFLMKCDKLLSTRQLGLVRILMQNLIVSA